MRNASSLYDIKRSSNFPALSSIHRDWQFEGFSSGLFSPLHSSTMRTLSQHAEKIPWLRHLLYTSNRGSSLVCTTCLSTSSGIPFGSGALLLFIRLAATKISPIEKGFGATVISGNVSRIGGECDENSSRTMASILPGVLSPEISQ